MEFHQKSIEFHQKSMDSIKKQWNSIKNPCNSITNQWNSIKNQWILINFGSKAINLSMKFTILGLPDAHREIVYIFAIQTVFDEKISAFSAAFLWWLDQAGTTFPVVAKLKRPHQWHNDQLHSSLFKCAIPFAFLSNGSIPSVPSDSPLSSVAGVPTVATSTNYTYWWHSCVKSVHYMARSFYPWTSKQIATYLIHVLYGPIISSSNFTTQSELCA